MSNAGLIISMGGIAIATAVVDTICNALGKGDIARYVTVAGLCIAGASAVGLAVNLLQTVSTIIK